MTADRATEAATVADSFPLGRGLSVTITVAPGHLHCEWEPRKPERLTPKQLTRYRRARHVMLERLAERTGRRVLCIET